MDTRKMAAGETRPKRGRIGRRPVLAAAHTQAEYVDGPIEGVIVRELRLFHDPRGWLVELFRHDELETSRRPVMAYASMTLPGVTRGPHEHEDQMDGFAFFGPSNFRLWAWDTRKESPTFGHRVIWVVGQTNPTAVWIPPGVVHAYRNIGAEPGLVFNAPNRLYAGWGKNEPVDEIRHEDADPSLFPMD
jgi:dTDP-4-dehydrorhamnose 3,5-epimerase